MSIWIPGFEHVHLPNMPTGGPYDEYRHPKFGWHTWEGHNLDAAEGAFAKYPPHCAVSWELGVRRQYIPLDLHSYAFAGNDNDDSYVIQVEVAGFAGESHEWPQPKLQWLGEQVVRPIALLCKIPPIVVWKGFHGEGEGLILASRQSPLRLTTQELDSFSGHLGHQHMPSPDVHWDPGRLPISTILDFATPHPVEEEEDMAYAFFTFEGVSRTFYGDWVHIRAVSAEDIKDIQASSGGKVPKVHLAKSQFDNMVNVTPGG